MDPNVTNPCPYASVPHALWQRKAKSTWINGRLEIRLGMLKFPKDGATVNAMKQVVIII
jgi:hypothetical protein